MNNNDLDKLVGSFLLLGFRGHTLTGNSELKEEIDRFSLSGVILFDKDMIHHKPVHNIQSPEQVRTLCADLQSASKTPLFIGVDQEGGIVNRLKPDYGFPETRSHKELGNMNDLEQTYQEGYKIGETLADCGINVNFAPCVDVDTNVENPIIHGKQRSFSANPQLVFSHAKAYSKGLSEHGVLAAIKHFPGHGSSFGDTHFGFTDVTETWNTIELEPYKDFFKEGYDEFVMSSHIFNRHLDEDYPATLSKKIITDLLRKELGFEGLVVSDDLQMGAITSKFGLETAIVLALNAGINIICFGNNLVNEPVSAKRVLEIIKEALEKGTLTEKVLEDNFKQIQNFKMKKILITK